MNKVSLFLLFSCLSIVIFSCKKDDVDPQQPAVESYMNLSAGSSRVYSFQENNPPTAPSSYTLTPAGRDTTVDGKVFTIFNGRNGSLEYYNVTGNNYYTLIKLPGGFTNDVFVNLYLKSDQPVNSSWTQNYTVDIPGLPLPATVVLTNKIVEKDITRTVSSLTYNNVIHVSSSISGNVGPLPITGLSSDINNYYAPKYGMIESSNIFGINFSGIQDSTNTVTKLTSSVIP